MKCKLGIHKFGEDCGDQCERCQKTRPHDWRQRDETETGRDYMGRALYEKRRVYRACARCGEQEKPTISWHKNVPRD